MKTIYVGIDISKEKCNLCFRSGLEIVREEECSNDVKALKKAFKAALKVLGASVDEVLVCAEYTGRYIYPLTVACQELDIFLWLDDPTRIKNSMGLARGKNDVIDNQGLPSSIIRNDRDVHELSIWQKLKAFRLYKHL